jgi:putative pyruvate formate lyase activating enzyme
MTCNLCPRKCNIDRCVSVGACGMDEKITVAKVMVHNWEEPPISGTKGSGAIFFSGCNLKCVYCQNREISHEKYGYEMTVEQLASKMLELQNMGVHNINLVTPTHYSDKIRDAIDLIKDRLHIPIIYNTSGYELDTEIQKMAGYVDIFLTDIKYYDSEISKKYSCATDYYENAKKSLASMLKIAPECIFDENGIMQRGVIIRHLVLPTLRKDSIKILEDVSMNFDISKVKLSLMCQYTPDFCPDNFKEIKRRVTTFEYNSVVDKALALGYDGYIQDISSSNKIYTPNFKDGTI